MPRQALGPFNDAMKPCLLVLFSLSVFALALPLFALAAARAVPAAPHTVILVRHAEKDMSTDPKDPELSSAGKQRAADLARLLAHAGVTRLVASEYQRTQATLTPLGAALGLAIETHAAQDGASLTKELAAAPPGSVTVVAGHSNTVPALAESLGAPLKELDESGSGLHDSQYDRLFVLTLPAAGSETAASALELRYGAQ